MQLEPEVNQEINGTSPTAQIDPLVRSHQAIKLATLCLSELIDI